MKTIAFIYGWSEGPWQSRKFRKLLQQKGIEVTDDRLSADVIIAHSSGSYLVPPKSKAKIIILIGLPFWPRRSLFKSALINLGVGWSNHLRGTNSYWWINKLGHNLWYVFTRPSATYFVFTKHSPANLPKPEAQTKIILIRNQLDSFCHPKIQEILPETQSYKLVKMPGDHEDCWLSPRSYVDLLLNEL